MTSNGSPQGNPFAQAQSRFQELHSQFRQGKLAPEAFAAAVAQLRVQDPQGFFWLLNPQTGVWLKWDGQRWAEAVPPIPASPPEMSYPDHRANPPRQAPSPAGRPAGSVSEVPSPFRAAESRFGELVRTYQAGRLNSEGFAAAVAELKVQDGQGFFWQINPQTGAWLRWDGQQWADAAPPASAPAPEASFSRPPSGSTIQDPTPMDGEVGRGRHDGASSADPSPFRAAEARLAELKRQYQAGQLAPEALNRGLAELRVQDGQGFFWQLNPQDASWLRWDGSTWVSGEGTSSPATSGPAHSAAPSPAPPAAPTPTAGEGGRRRQVGASSPAPSPASGISGGGRPATGGAMPKLTDLPALAFRQFVERLVPALLTGFSVWFIHAILLVWKNHGFNFDDPFYGPLLNAKGGTASPTSASVIWGMPIALVWSFVISFLKNGPTATTKALFGGPALMASLPFKGGSSLAGFCLGSGAGMILFSMFGLNWQASVVFSTTSVFLLAGYPGMLLSQFLGGLWNTMAGNPLVSAARRIQDLFHAIVVGLAPGFIFMTFLPSLGSVAAVGCLAAGIYLLVSQTPANPSGPASPAPAQPMGGAGGPLMMWILTTAAATALLDLLFSSPAWADDGGGDEISGGDGTDNLNYTNVVAWWNSSGSGSALNQGIPPTVTSTAGAALIPPLAPPTDGLVIQDDIIKGEKTEEDEVVFEYSCYPQTTGGALIPADGRTPQQFYAICSSSNPKWTQAQMNTTVQFSFTAPTGFSLQAQQQFSSGDVGYKHVDVICVPPADAAYAPGKIPGVVYATASTPSGQVRGHYQVEIEVGGGEMILHPLEREWVRGPMAGQAPDSLTLFGRLALPNYCKYVPDKELNANLTLRTVGEFANYLFVSPPEDPEGWRSWTVGPNSELQPAHYENGITVELGMEGRIMAGLLQKTFPLKILPYLKLKFEPSEPFLVPEFLKEIEVLATVQGAGPGEQWSIEEPLYSSGDQDIIIPGSVTPKLPAEAKLKFRLGSLPDNRDEATATFKVKAKLTKAVKDYNGPSETEETDLTVNVRRPGLIFLTKMPVKIPGDGKTVARFEITVLKYTPGPAGQPGVLSVDESKLKKNALKFAETVEAEGAAAKSFGVAALQITYVDVLGEGLGRRAAYSVKGSTVVPGSGEIHLGKLEVSDPTPPKEAQEKDYCKNLELSLTTFKVEGKGDTYDAEKKLMLNALDEMILRPYSTLQAAWADAHKLEWEADWVRSWFGRSTADSLEDLMKLYDKFKNDLEKDPRRDPFTLHDRRYQFYQEVTKAWEAVATASAGVDTVLAAGENTAVFAKWASEALLPKLVEIYMLSLGRSPKWADFSGSATGYFQTKLNDFIGRLSQAYVDENPHPWKKAGQETVDKIWEDLVPDLCDVFYGAALEKPFEETYKWDGLPGSLGTVHALKIKARLYTYFAIIKLFQHWIWEKKENGDDKGFVEACGEVVEDLAIKTVADTFEWFCGDVPADRRSPITGKMESAQSDLRGALREKYQEIKEFLQLAEVAGRRP